MLNKAIGIVLVFVSVAYYGYWYSNPSFTPDMLFWAKMAISGLAGIGVLGFEAMPYITGLTNKTASLKTSNLEVKDFEAIMYLKKRLKSLNSKDGLKSLQDLNDILFKMDIKYADDNTTPSA